MRFTHGIWETREHTTLYDAVEVASVSTPSPNKLRALCATRHIKHRGNTLNRATITVEFETVAPGIIACSATHFRGGLQSSNEPRFELFPDGSAARDKNDQKVTISHDDEAKTSTLPGGGGFEAVVDRNPSHFRVKFQSDGSDDSPRKTLTSLGYQGVQYIVAPNSAPMPTPLDATTEVSDSYYRPTVAPGSRPHMVVSLDLQVGELVYGLGERFGPLTKNGQSVDIWNEDAGTISPHSKCDGYCVKDSLCLTKSAAYKNVPFYMTNRGYGVFFDHSDLVSLEVQTERLGKVQVSVQGEQIRWFIINGPTPKEVNIR
jgi:alpha-D-xyloside xylohydrolase